MLSEDKIGEEMELIFDGLYSRNETTLEQALLETSCTIDPNILGFALGLRLYENLRILIENERMIIFENERVNLLFLVNMILHKISNNEIVCLSTGVGLMLETLTLNLVDDRAVYYEVRDKWYYQKS